MSITNSGPRISIRMYRQGLGDCFLLKIEENSNIEGKVEYKYILIDFGVLMGTANAKYRMKEVARHIIEETEGKLDILVATHEHYDHLSGFNQARDVLEAQPPAKSLDIEHLWLAWTEDENEPLAQELRKKRKKSEQKLHLALKKMKRLGLDNNRTDQLAAILGFALGEDEEGAGDETTGLAFALDESNHDAVSEEDGTIANMPKRYMKHVLPYLRKKVDKHGEGVNFLSPGEHFKISGIEGVRFYVLGPPKDKKMIKDSNPNKGEAYGLKGNFSLEASFYQGLGFDEDADAKNEAAHSSAKDYPFSRNYKLPYNTGEKYLLRNRIIELLSKDNFAGLDKLLKNILIEKLCSRIKFMIESPDKGGFPTKNKELLNGSFLLEAFREEKFKEDNSNQSLQARIKEVLCKLLLQVLAQKETIEKELNKSESLESLEETEGLEEIFSPIVENQSKRNSQSPSMNPDFSLDFELLLKNIFVLRYGNNWERYVHAWLAQMIRKLLKEQAKKLAEYKLKYLLFDENGMKKEAASEIIYRNETTSKTVYR